FGRRLPRGRAGRAEQEEEGGQGEAAGRGHQLTTKGIEARRSAPVSAFRSLTSSRYSPAWSPLGSKVASSLSTPSTPVVVRSSSRRDPSGRGTPSLPKTWPSSSSLPWP